VIHKYTIEEIDALTDAVRSRYFPRTRWSFTADGFHGSQETEGSKAEGYALAQMTQDKVRTLMLAGVKAEDVLSVEPLP